MQAPTRATLRPGCEVFVIDVSPGGALVEAKRPLRPGACVHVQFSTRERQIAVTAHILRCVVWSLGASEGIVYRGALQFERRCLCFSGRFTVAEDAVGAAPQSACEDHPA